MAKEISRYIKHESACELWGRAAGRCEFDGCNRPLYKSPVTQERVNIAQRAHIYSFAPSGARGIGPFRRATAETNDVANLMLLCYDCHQKVDKDKVGVRYSAQLLIEWKTAHEKRVAIATGVAPGKKSHVVLYGANIGEVRSNLQPQECNDALFPERYPADEHAIQLSMKWGAQDRDAAFWPTEQKNLEDEFARLVQPALDQGNPYYLSVFALAPMPLLISLGSLLTDKVPVDVYQRHREPAPTWKWITAIETPSFRLIPPAKTDHPPALILSVSAAIAHNRVSATGAEPLSLWEITVDHPNLDVLKTKEQLSQFRIVAREAIAQIGRVHGHTTTISIYPAVPVACAVELGRIRMPKVDAPWKIFDQNNANGGFAHALTVGSNV